MFGPKMMRKFFGAGPWKEGSPWQRGGFGPGQRQVFGKGDLKYVILDLLREQSAHGYELMKALEERFGGFYSPSAGSVYPTLQLLEDLGYVGAVHRDGKKVYEITEEGRKFLEENRGTVEDIWGRADAGWDPEFAAEIREMWHEVGGIGRMFGHEMRTGGMNREKLRNIREVIARAAREVEEILKSGRGDTRV